MIVTVKGVGNIEIGPQTVAQIEANFNTRHVDVIVYPQYEVVASFPMTKRGHGKAFDVAHDINALVRSLFTDIAPAKPLPKTTVAEDIMALWG